MSLKILFSLHRGPIFGRKNNNFFRQKNQTKKRLWVVFLFSFFFLLGREFTTKLNFWF